LKKVESDYPDKEIVRHSLYIAFAIIFEIVVLPVPGGPVKSIARPFVLL